MSVTVKKREQSHEQEKKMSIKAGDYVRLEKQEAVEEPEVPTPSNEDYEAGKENFGVSVPKGYWIIGRLINDPEVDTMLHIARDCRNGVKVSGVLTTSPVTKVDEAVFGLRLETLNSVYHLSLEADPSPPIPQEDALNAVA